MKRIIRIVKNSYKIIIAFVLGICISVTSVYAVDAYIESKKVSYNNKYTDKNNTQEAIDELYERSGIHKEKWIDPVLNGADPVLKDPLIPVEIKPNGDVYYANLNSEWYNYSEKRWANAVILIDNPSNKNYKAGDHILEDDIESYFVWIPRYQYKIWDLGEYNSIIPITSLSDAEVDAATDKAFWTASGNSARIIDIHFCIYEKCPKMNESEAVVDKYYTHPAFTLGTKNLNGFWMGKFEVSYKDATSGNSAQVNVEDSTKIIIKPNSYSWRSISAKKMFMSSYKYERGTESHMLKNTEWGAAAYLSNSAYGIGGEIRINNHSEEKTGYATAPNVRQDSFPGIAGTDESVTMQWNTPVGYLASTTGNISGVYDMSGGIRDLVAGCIDGNPGSSEFTKEELENYMNLGYIDRYPADSTVYSYNKRILGDATGELGPFFSFRNNDGVVRNHSAWYSGEATFLRFNQNGYWIRRGGDRQTGIITSQFSYHPYNGAPTYDSGFRLALSP